jgi:hypothetical protein
MGGQPAMDEAVMKWGVDGGRYSGSEELNHGMQNWHWDS